jgi:hypothetical protein
MNFKNLSETDLNTVAVNLVYDALSDVGTKLRARDILGYDAPYDILWQGLKLTVKIANVSHSSRFPKWSYTVTTATEAGMTDFFILLAVKDNKIFKAFAIPAEVAPKTTVVINEKMGKFKFETFALDNLGQLQGKIEEIASKLPSILRMHKEANG